MFHQFHPSCKETGDKAAVQRQTKTAIGDVPPRRSTLRLGERPDVRPESEAGTWTGAAW